MKSESVRDSMCWTAIAQGIPVRSRLMSPEREGAASLLPPSFEGWHVRGGSSRPAICLLLHHTNGCSSDLTVTGSNSVAGPLSPTSSKPLRPW